MKLDVGSVGSIAEITDVDISSRTAIVDVRDEVVVFLRLTGSQDVVVVRHSGHIVKIGRVGVNIPIHQLIKNLEINFCGGSKTLSSASKSLLAVYIIICCATVAFLLQQLKKILVGCLIFYQKGVVEVFVFHEVNSFLRVIVDVSFFIFVHHSKLEH